VLLYLLGLSARSLLTSVTWSCRSAWLKLAMRSSAASRRAALGDHATSGLVLPTLSQVNVVYGSMTTAIVVLSARRSGRLLLFGAQVISDTSARPATERAAEGFRTEACRSRRQQARPAPEAGRRCRARQGVAGNSRRAEQPRETAAHRRAPGAREERAPQVLQRQRHHRHRILLSSS
jgi:hypothetical protein